MSFQTSVVGKRNQQGIAFEDQFCMYCEKGYIDKGLVELFLVKPILTLERARLIGYIQTGERPSGPFRRRISRAPVMTGIKFNPDISESDSKVNLDNLDNQEAAQVEGAPTPQQDDPMSPVDDLFGDDEPCA